MDLTPEQESFEDFIKSFFYGKRSDLSFKFMSELPLQEASDFLTSFFKDIVDAIDDNNLDAVKQSLLNGQIQGYRQQKNFDYDSGPFLKPDRPVSSLKVSLLTSSGHFVKGRDPEPLGVKNMSQSEAERRVMEFLKEPPQLSAIPFETPIEDLVVRHGGYDIRGALKDPNVCLPYQAMKIIKETGIVAQLTEHAFSFVGTCSQIRLQKETLPQWFPKLQQEGMDAVVLVPV